jgi:hypothetical protein
MTRDQDKVLARALEMWGVDAQVRQTLEELTELQLALLKWWRNPTDENTHNIIEELADAKVMIRQMELVFGAPEVQQVVAKKIERLETKYMKPKATEEEAT